MKNFKLVPTYEPLFLMSGLEKENKTPHCFDITYADRQVWHIFSIKNKESKEFFSILTELELESFLKGNTLVLKPKILIPYLKETMGVNKLKRQLKGIEDSIKNIPFYNGEIL